MRNVLSRMIQGFQAVARGFLLGPGTTAAWEGGWGREATQEGATALAEYQSANAGVYACINLRARHLASVPLRLYKKGKGKGSKAGERTEVEDGTLRELLDKVNPFWTWNRLIQMTEASLCTWGACFWFLERGATGKAEPSEIWWARADMVRVVVDQADYIKGFIYDENGVNLRFMPSETIWMRYPNIADEFAGLSPLTAARLSIESAMGAIKANNKIFKNGYLSAGIVAPQDKDQHMTREQAADLEAAFALRARGVDKAHSMMFLPHAVGVQSLSVSPKDAEFMGIMGWGLGDVCRVYQVPPMLVQDFTRATYSNAEQAYKALWNDCLTPECRFIASELTEQLLPMFPGQADEAEFDTSGVAVLQEDRAEITTQARQWWDMGVPLNRVLQEFQPNLLPPGSQGYPWGDEQGGKAPMPTADPAGAPTGTPGPKDAPADEPPPEDEEPPATVAEAAGRIVRAWERLKAEADPKGIAYGSEAHQARAKAFSAKADVLEAKVRRVVTKALREQAARFAAKLAEAPPATKAAADDDEWAYLYDAAGEAAALSDAITPALEQVIREAGAATYEDLALEISFDVSTPEVSGFLAQRAQRFAEQVNETTWGRVRDSLNEGREAGEDVQQLAQRIEDEMGDRIRSSGETIARTETMGALNGGTLLAAKQSGVVDRKGWLAALDGRERESHRKAHEKYQVQPIPLDDTFRVGKARGPAPGQMGSAEEDVNCRCSLTFEVNEDEDGQHYGGKVHIPSTVIDGLKMWLERK